MVDSVDARAVPNPTPIEPTVFPKSHYISLSADRQLEARMQQQQLLSTGNERRITTASLLETDVIDSQSRREIIDNPFSPQNQTRLKEWTRQVEVARYLDHNSLTAQDLARPFETSDEAPWDVLSEIIAIEPSGEYEDRFYTLQNRGESVDPASPLTLPERRRLRQQQRSMLQTEVITNAYITSALEREVLGHMDEYMQLPPEEIWRRLNHEAFQTEDHDTIMANFSSDERAGYRLSILNFIRDLSNIKKLHEQVTAQAPNNIGRQAELVLGRPEGFFTEKPDMKVNPAGFIITLSGEDYDKVRDLWGDALRGGEAGVYLNTPISNQSPLTWASVILINRDIQDEEELPSTELHETRHAIYERFHKTDRPVNYREAEARAREKEAQEAEKERAAAEREDSGETEEEKEPEPKKPEARDVLGTGRVLRRYVDAMLSTALNESMAYLAEGQQSPDALFAQQFAGNVIPEFMIQIRDEFAIAPNLTPAERQEAWDMYLHSYQRYFQTLRTARIVMRQLLDHGHVPPAPNGRVNTDLGSDSANREAFFTALFINDAHSPLLKLRRYSHMFLGRSLEDVLRTGRDDAERMGRIYSANFMRFTEMTDDQIRAELKSGEGGHDMWSYFRSPKVDFPSASFLPGALALLRQDRGTSATRVLLARIGQVVYLNQDTLDTQALFQVGSALTALQDKKNMSGNTDNEEEITELLKTLQTIKGIREATFN